MSEPLTEAGRKLRALLEEIGVRDPERGLIEDAEAGARAAAFDEIAAAVRATPVVNAWMRPVPPPAIDRDAVLAAITEARQR